MKRTVLPVIVLMTISVLFMGTIIGASSNEKNPTIIKTDSPAAQVANVETIQITPIGSSGNWRGPGVGEDSKGNRLAVFRGPEGNKYYYSYCPKNGTWSAPAVINNGDQPSLIDYGSAYIEIDSNDNFHCGWENANAYVYASFKNGVWTTPTKISSVGRYDKTGALTVNSDDQVITIACQVLGGFIKEVFLHRKGKNDATFGTPFNLSRDGQIASTQPHLAVNSEDHVWAVWKSDRDEGVGENLVIYLSEFNTDNSDLNDWILVSPNPGWNFLPQVAVNSEDKVMTLFSCSTVGQYMTRFYDPATKKISELGSLEIGLCRVPWHTFVTRLAAHGKDFYAAAFDASRTLFLLKYIQTTNKWEQVAIIPGGVEQLSLYSGYKHMIIAWSTMVEPTNVFITTVEVDPYSKIRIKSVSNLVVTKRTERGFFKGYTLNALTWEANPVNTEKGITITAQRIYRKSRSEDNTKWARIGEVEATVFKYEDRNIPADSDYVYAVTCVDDQEHESLVF